MTPGDPLPPLERTLELVDLVAYAGATWDWHRMHYDTDFAAEAGLPGPLVDGQMFGAMLASQLRRAFGPAAFIAELGFRFRSMVFAGETIRCEGEVTEVADGHAHVTLRVTVGERVAVEATAKVRT